MAEQEQLEQTEHQEGQTENTEKQTQNNKEKDQKKQKPIVQAREAPSEDALIFDFEVCQNCQEHAWCTHHDEEKYVKLYIECQQLIESSIPNSYCTFNQGIVPNTGSFEIRHKGILIYSKKNTQLFPQPPLLVERLKKFLDDLENKRDVTKWSTKKEVKYQPPKQKKERETFQTYMKKREEEERRQKEQKEQARIQAEQEEQKKREEEQRRQEQLQKEEEERKKKEQMEEETRKLELEKEENERLAEEKKRMEQQEQEQQDKQQENQQVTNNQEQNQQVE
ncbi:unnamed protein product [Paramecium pentaurelia]|uniref:Uncharacterized protein n=1 Tax=Paramecium pentaurelia TaxID=43138 RepID=A0A8S1WLM2_9CILI|nr:unnamed protein product [Paramecium pentaurelia]